MAEFVRFPTTLWSTIVERPRDAREAVFVRYREPVLAFIRNQGFAAHDAEDLAQEVFLRVCQEGFLRDADRTKGRFRSLLLAVTRHVIQHERERRGRPVPPAPAPAASEDAAFDTLWLSNLVTLALKRLAADAVPGGPRAYEAFTLHKHQGLTYRQIADKLGVSLDDVRNWIHAAKSKLKKLIADEIRAYCSSQGELDDELAQLLRNLK